MGFPEDFAWGAASAAYQIEGGAYEDGKGESVWDYFSRLPGKIYGDQNGEVAADAYHRWEEDLDLMQELGIPHYRFSISWPRIFGDGRGPEPNPKGLAYYDRVVDGCLSRGITPWITLYHWDLPLALYRQGGWLSRDTAEHFADYAACIARHFAGRVRHYITVNEPQCAIGMGLGMGLHAPGDQLDEKDLFLAWHHLLLAHGLAVRQIRKILPDARIGAASTGALTYLTRESCRRLADLSSSREPAGALAKASCLQGMSALLTEGGYLKQTPEALARAAFCTPESGEDSGHFFNHQWFLDPLIFGRYPDDPGNPWAAFAQRVHRSDLTVIAEPVDFIGLNIYNGHEMLPSCQPGRQEEGGGLSLRLAEKYPGYPRTALKWPVTPEVLYWGPRLIWERYGKPVCIMENGQSCNDRIFLDGAVHDPDRIDFLHRYLRELKLACEDDIPVQAYFHWSFTDNFEWHSGYEERFGLVYIDYPSQRRILKDSARWYAGLIRCHGANLDAIVSQSPPDDRKKHK